MYCVYPSFMYTSCPIICLACYKDNLNDYLIYNPKFALHIVIVQIAGFKLQKVKQLEMRVFFKTISPKRTHLDNVKHRINFGQPNCSKQNAFQ